MTKAVRSLRTVLMENAFFFAAFAVFSVIGAVWLMISDKGEAVLFFSRHRSPFGDLFFVFADNLGDGILFLPLLVSLLFYRFRFAATVPGLGLSVLVVTQTAKAFFGHPRPLPYLEKMDLLDQIVPVDGVTINQGMNSFPSGHTMTAFAIFSFLAFCLPHKKWNGLFFFSLAFIAGLSRIYLVQHFFQDVYAGAILGVLLSLVWYMAQYRIWPEPHGRMDGKLSFGKGAKRYL